MSYAAGRVIHDADSHIMESLDWLPSYADAAIRDRLISMRLEAGGSGAAKAIELAQRRQQDAAVGRIRDHAQRSARLVREGLGELADLLDLGTDRARVRQHRFTRGGEKNPASGTLHELHAHGFFEVGDRAADRDLGNAISTGGRGESIELDDSREDSELSSSP